MVTLVSETVHVLSEGVINEAHGPHCSPSNKQSYEYNAVWLQIVIKCIDCELFWLLTPLRRGHSPSVEQSESLLSNNALCQVG